MAAGKILDLFYWFLGYSKCLAIKADQLILSQYPIVIAYCSRASKGSPSIPSDNVTKWIAKFAFFPHNRDRGKKISTGNTLSVTLIN